MKLIKNILASSLMLVAVVTAPVVSAGYNLYAGTNCMTANLAQGQLFSWNKDGIKNNSALDLYVICPFSVNKHDWDATPQISVSVSAYMPDNYGPTGKIGPRCLVRWMEASEDYDAPDDQDVIANVVMDIGAYDTGGNPGGDTDTATVLATTSTNSQGNGHLLCLVPKNGGAIVRYSVDTR